eukprot:scaffold2079_cov122-Isochrysis_galbana.AAC.6
MNCATKLLICHAFPRVEERRNRETVPEGHEAQVGRGYSWGGSVGSACTLASSISYLTLSLSASSCAAASACARAGHTSSAAAAMATLGAAFGTRV